MSGVSLEGTGDTPDNLTTPYKIYLPYPVNKPNPLKLLAITSFVF